jgi:hypothetical protein
VLNLVPSRKICKNPSNILSNKPNGESALSTTEKKYEKTHYEAPNPTISSPTAVSTTATAATSTTRANLRLSTESGSTSKPQL